jgi:tetratricopeptide (TPR) repeat protein
LVKKAKILEESGDLDGAIESLRLAAGEIAPENEPRLLVYARHNLIWCLATAGRFEEAERLLPEVHALFAEVAKPLDLVRLRWTEGRIAVGRGRLEAAEGLFREVQEEFLRRGMGYDAALVALDLGVLYAEQGRTADLKRLAAELVPVFESREVRREALAALVLFQHACEEERLTVEMARHLAELVRRERRAAG